MKREGIYMSKLYGNAVVGQSGGPTAAINATLAGVIRGVLEINQREGAIGTLYGMRNGIEGLMQERLIDLCEFAKDADKLDALELTPAAALGSCRKKLPKHGDDPEFYDANKWDIAVVGKDKEVEKNTILLPKQVY